MNEKHFIFKNHGWRLGFALAAASLGPLDRASAADLSARDLTARDIMVKNESARHVDEMESTDKIITGTRGQSGEKIKDFTLWRKVSDDKVHNKTLTRFHTPAEVRDEGILIIENEGGKNDVLLYLPNFKKIRRVETQQQSGSFMGSVFSYSDIATPHVDDYEYKKLREEPCPAPDAQTIKCFVIEAKPVNDDIRDRTGYTKSEIWLRNDNFMVVAAHYTGLDGELFKKLLSTEIKIVDPVNKKWHSYKIEIENIKTHEFTTLQTLKAKVNGGISNSVFTQQNLSKVN